jgi:uncharacterized protein
MRWTVVFMAEDRISYVEAGEGGTDETLRVAALYALENKIRNIVVASTRGYTAEKALRLLEGKDINIIVVTHVWGFRQPDANEFPDSLRKQMEAAGVKVLSAAHAFGGVNKLAEDSIGEIVANTLRIFSQGAKVCVEIVTEAADAGLVRTDEDAIAIGGTGKGADTAIVIRPANSTKLFESKVRRILAMPNR